MRIAYLKAPDTWPLRHLVLRPHQPIEECDYPNDRNPDSFHLGAFSKNELIAIASFYKERKDGLTGWIQYRLRGMAVHPDQRGKGVGGKLLVFGFDHLRDLKADLLWCNARDNAKGFYLAHGMEVHGPPFTIEGIGEHQLMFRRL
ncbi:MAG: GNAT family N-acetyltransferase [Flavobacteriales bacterium]|nr:GNAT family N-acetyltransferase [Flavobacteriales bacterium]MBP6696562.1 GNAT family N-acetyltransferase [Flavobacteriales bacterium]